MLIYVSIIFSSTTSKRDFLNWSIIITSAISIALIADGIIFLIVQEATSQGYWEKPSIIGTFLFSLTIIFYCIILHVHNKRKEKIKINLDCKPPKIRGKTNLFYFNLSVVSAVFLSRMLVFLVPDTSTIIFGCEIHHYYTGLLLVIIITPINIFHPTHNCTAKFFSININHIYIIFLGFGVGLMVDQIMFILNEGITDYDYWQPISFISAIVSTILIISISIYIYHIKHENLKG